MLEQLKKAEELVKKFNSLPEEQRYIYDKGVGEVILIKMLDSIRLEHDSSNLYCFKGHVASNKNRWWSSYFYSTDLFVTKEEAYKHLIGDGRELEKKIEEIKNKKTGLEHQLEDLEEELRKLKGRNKC